MVFYPSSINYTLQSSAILLPVNHPATRVAVIEHQFKQGTQGLNKVYYREL